MRRVDSSGFERIRESLGGGFFGFRMIFAQDVAPCLSVPALSHDLELSQLWVEDRLQRKASWSELRSVVFMLSQVLGDSIMTDSALPETATVRPLHSFEVREQTGEGWFLVDTRPGGLRVPIFKKSFCFHTLRVVAQVMDRGPIGSAGMMMACTYGGMLWPLHWGRRHDCHNSLKNGINKGKRPRVSSGRRSFASAVWRTCATAHTAPELGATNCPRTTSASLRSTVPSLPTFKGMHESSQLLTRDGIASPAAMPPISSWPIATSAFCLPCATKANSL